MNWQIARAQDDAQIVVLCRALFEEDPAPQPVPEAYMRSTLQRLRAEPVRGVVAVLRLDGQVVGYALLIGFWLNELGGEVCQVDELYVMPGYRGRGHSTTLLQSLGSAGSVWPRPFVALQLEVSPTNLRARQLYARLGFFVAKNAFMRRTKPAATD